MGRVLSGHEGNRDMRALEDYNRQRDKKLGAKKKETWCVDQRLHEESGYLLRCDPYDLAFGDIGQQGISEGTFRGMLFTDDHSACALFDILSCCGGKRKGTESCS